MKISTAFTLLLMPMAAVSQNYQGINEADMQKMMEQAQKMQACIEKVDQSQFKALEQRQEQFDAEVRSLCAKGKRDEAQNKAILFSKEMMNEPSMKAMQKCGEMMKGSMPMMQDMPFMDQEEDTSNKHVCDSLD